MSEPPAGFGTGAAAQKSRGVHGAAGTRKTRSSLSGLSEDGGLQAESSLHGSKASRACSPKSLFGQSPAGRSSSGHNNSWYPGKYMKEGMKVLQDMRDAHMAGEFEKTKPHREIIALVNGMKGRRPLMRRDTDTQAVGYVCVSILRGHFSTKRPYFIVEMDRNEECTAVAFNRSPVFGEGTLPPATFRLPVYDPSSDLRLFLCDDSKAKNPKGRAIIPLRDLCTRSVVPMPKPEHHLTLLLMPAQRQWGANVEARYEEAVRNVPGSGMVRPSKDVGTVEILVRLELDCPGHERWGLLAAYAQVEPPGAVEEDMEDSGVSNGEIREEPSGGKQKQVAFAPKLLRGNVNRLSRCLRVPYILQGKAVFALLAAHAVACAFAEVYHVPWILLGLAAASGTLDHVRREEQMEELIFWEEEVGESDMPNGIEMLLRIKPVLANLQETMGTHATTLERMRNTWNFADPPVTFVAIVCTLPAVAGSSIILFLVSMRIILFCVGAGVLLPFLKRSLIGPAKATTKEASADANSERLLRKSNAAKQTPHFVRALQNVLGRVPDGRDLVHQYWCSKQVLRQDMINVV